MYFNKKRWNECNKRMGLSSCILCEPRLLSYLFYITHTEEEIFNAEREAIQNLIEIIE